MWQTKTFKTLKGMKWWIKRSGHLYEWEQVFVNNGYAVVARRLRRVM